MGPSGAPFVSFPPKVGKNNIYMGSLWATFGPLWSPSGLHLGRFGVPLRPFGGQNGANIGSKSRKKSIKTCTSIPHLFLHRFFTDICSPARRTENHGNLVRFTVFQRLKRFPLELCFGFDFGFKNGAFWHPFDDFLGAFETMDPRKVDPRPSQKAPAENKKL